MFFIGTDVADVSLLAVTLSGGGQINNTGTGLLRNGSRLSFADIIIYDNAISGIASSDFGVPSGTWEVACMYSA
jgi:hypothetical protein